MPELRLETTDWLPVPDDLPPGILPLDMWLDKTHAYVWFAVGARLKTLLDDDFSLVNGDGKLLTRTTNKWYKEYKSELPPELRTSIDMYLSRVPARPTHYRIHDRIDWEVGDYGDVGSCFWAAYKNHRAAAVMAGAHALLLREEREEKNGGTRGLGRMLLFAPRETSIVATNRYGSPIDMFRHVLGKHYEGHPVSQPGATRFTIRFLPATSRSNVEWYANGDAIYVGEDRSSTILLDQCACVRYYSGLDRAAENEVICPKCPFGRTAEK